MTNHQYKNVKNFKILNIVDFLRSRVELRTYYTLTSQNRQFKIRK